MAKKTDFEGEPFTPNRDAPPDLATTGREWLEAENAIASKKADFHALMKDSGVTSSRPYKVDGRRFYPGRNGTIGEVVDFA